jgi:hypothetical protein
VIEQAYFGFSNRPVGVKLLSDYPPVRCRCQSRARASDACRAITGSAFSETTKARVVRSSPALTSRLLKLHETVGQIAESVPGILELPEVVRSLEQQFVHLMVRCLTEGVSSGRSAARRRHDLIVTRFEEFLAANPNKPLYLPEICAAICTAERTFRVACEDRLAWGQSAISPCGECTSHAVHSCEKTFQQRSRKLLPTMVSGS